MGSEQSTMSSNFEKRLDLRASESADDYVHVEASEKSNLIDVKERNPEGLALDRLVGQQTGILSDPKNRLALTALSTANPRSVLKSTAVEMADQHVFNVKIPFEGGPITNQRSSGRCWLFASTNTFRVALMQRYGLSEFELSQSYLFFWDKLEKSNWFLEQIIDTAAEPLDGRLVQHLLGDIVSDGGQWDMVYNLVTKYGLVPQTLYPDSFNAKASSTLNSMLKTKLREYAMQLRKLCAAPETHANGKQGSGRVDVARIAKAKAEMMQQVQMMLTLTLGAPPKPTETFAWQFVDKDGKPREVTATPLEFAQNIYAAPLSITAKRIARMMSLVHDPRHEPLTLMTVPRLGNVVGGRGVTYVNVDMKTLKDASAAMLKAGLPVFFGSDVGQFSDSQSGVMDLGLYDYEVGFNVSLRESDKATRLRTGESQMTHAMVLTAVHVDPKTGKYVRWRVQNSWGTDRGERGWFVMTDEWMDEFVYQAVVDPSFVSAEVREVLKGKAVELPVWDPMGSLA
ncbi:hypothetical protein TD95_004377 [Thielaviopsis punctulata]|uniref:Cysteine proteinase 1, mitochondrial n=1 Tax=Thielaviopsis punctulata TaxID=72032 RepID=A0A0F4ZDI2_9PEZI|nr:hypothetical protein TD95_004377 [Thielaviopsis punctulata]